MKEFSEEKLRKRLASSLDYEFSRSFLSVTLYREDRDYETTDEDDTFWGVRSRWTWDMLPRTQLLLRGNWEHQDLDNGEGENDLGNFSAEVRRTIRENMTLGLRGSYYTRNSDESFDYDDTSGMLRFEASF